MAVYKQDLDQLACSIDGKKDIPLWFHSKCHPKNSIEARYCRGILTIRCGKCDKLVAEIVVAESL